MVQLVGQARKNFEDKKIDRKLHRRFWRTLRAYDQGQSYKDVLYLIEIHGRSSNSPWFITSVLQYKDDLIDFDIWPAGLPDLSSNVLGIINDDENLAMKQELESALIRLKVAEEENALLKKKLENIKDIRYDINSFKQVLAHTRSQQELTGQKPSKKQHVSTKNQAFKLCINKEAFELGELSLEEYMSSVRAVAYSYIDVISQSN
ncbi:unnamed protein product [Didymodactylos carnosus]|uniref:Uncharacterized protein n=1 Tax=Didymodactylos carnosus TaxID=1234261 RepID=A0A8S2HA03_9BILA|nr:unnamed protein product [Didymodactylos carnosus]CAF3621036.1 unnamed protein product [Didymodactylos carnosus]